MDFEYDLLVGGNGTEDTYVDLDEKFADLVIDVTEMKGNYH